MHKHYIVVNGIVIGKVYGLKPVFQDTKELNFHVQSIEISKDKLSYAKNKLQVKDFWLPELADHVGLDIVIVDENKDTEDVLYYPDYYTAGGESPFENTIEQDDIFIFKDIYLEALTSKKNPVVREIKSANWDTCLSQAAKRMVDDINDPKSEASFENTIQPMVDYVNSDTGETRR